MAMVVPSLSWHSAAATDRGRRRARNEDAVLVLPASRVYAVADGMGGHVAGNVASRLATETLASEFERAPSPRIGAPALARRFISAFDAVNAAILRHASARPSYAGMGTTLTAIAPLVASPQCIISHIGDSRAYRFRAGSLVQLTRDHTWVQQQVDAGMLTPLEARHHPVSSVLSRVLGTSAVGPPDTFTADVIAGDVFMLCSDGLTNMLDDLELRGLLAESLPVDAMVARLVDVANARGGDDNISVVLLQCAAS